MERLDAAIGIKTPASKDLVVLDHELDPSRGRALNALLDRLATSKPTVENSAVAFASVDGGPTCSGAVIPFGAGTEADG
jgi:hypothetical protein